MRKTKSQINAALRPLSKSTIDSFHLAQARMSRKDFAIALGSNYQTVSNWMGGYAKWPAEKLDAAREILALRGVKV